MTGLAITRSQKEVSMSHPYDPDDHSESPTAVWGKGGSDETKVVRPSESAERADPFSAPMPTVAGSPTGESSAGTPATGPGTDYQAAPEPGGWQPYSEQPYSEQPAYESQPAVTSVYPQSTPGYAPVGYPPAYAPATVVPPPASATLPTQPSSRVGPAFLMALIGLILTAGGLYLGAKYGIATATDLNRNAVVIKDSALATVGAVLLLGAVIANGWSPWATVIPGIVLTGLGGWALFDASAASTIHGWTKSVISGEELSAWHISGFTLILGLVMLAASTAAAIARASGKRDGAILGRRQA